MSKAKHLPLRVALMTPSRIDTAADRCITVAWAALGEGIENPYAEAEEFAAFIVRAVNAHDEMVGVLECATLNRLLGMVVEQGDDEMWETACWFMERRNAVLAKARGEV